MRKYLILLLLTGLGAVLICSCNNPTIPIPAGPTFSLRTTLSYSVIGTPGPGSANGEFSRPIGIAVDQNGNIYVMDYNNSRIQKFNSQGQFLLAWSSVQGLGIAVDGNNFVYVACPSAPGVFKYDANGNPVTLLSSWGGSGTGPGKFNCPQGIAVDTSGHVFVADSFCLLTGVGNRISEFESNGTFLQMWGTGGAGQGQFNNPQQIAVDNSGNVYVADYANHRVQKFDENGNYLSQLGGSAPSTANGQFFAPTGVTADSSNDVYVSDANNTRIQKFDSNGNFVFSWAYAGGSVAYLGVDNKNNVYDSDQAHNKVITAYLDGLSNFNTFGLFPNPVQRGQIENFELELSVQESFSVTIEDLQAKTINQYQGQGSIGTYILNWNLTDSNSHLIEPGDYLAIFSSGSAAVTQQFSCVP